MNLIHYFVLYRDGCFPTQNNHGLVSGFDRAGGQEERHCGLGRILITMGGEVGYFAHVEAPFNIY